MLMLIDFVLAALGLRFKSESRLEAENAALRHQVKVLRRQVRGRVRLTNLDRLFSGLALPLVSFDLEGHRHHSAGNPGALASGRLSMLLALEVTTAGRAATS